MDLSLPERPFPVAILVPGSLHTDISKSLFLKSSLEEAYQDIVGTGKSQPSFPHATEGPTRATWANGSPVWPMWCYSSFTKDE